MATGTVKWFNDSKGFGFITPSEGGEDLFAHHTAIQMSGFKTLKEGQKVEFEVKRGPKGLQAHNIKPCKSRKARNKPAGGLFHFKAASSRLRCRSIELIPCARFCNSRILTTGASESRRVKASRVSTRHSTRPSAVTLAERGERSMKATSPKVMPEVKELSRLTPFWVGTLTIAEPRVITKSSSELCPAATIVCPR